MSEIVFDPLTTVSAKPLIIKKANVDTDQIMPARFLTATSREGFGKFAFYDWRYDNQGTVKPDEVLNTTPPHNRKIMVADKNFGCGSSREHAPWGLYDYGVRVVLAESIADIFKNNCSKNGIAAIDISEETYRTICENPETTVTVNLEDQTVNLGDQQLEAFSLDSLARECLMSGKDQLSLLIAAGDDIGSFEANQGS